jgi:hypothetical protein
VPDASFIREEKKERISLHCLSVLISAKVFELNSLQKTAKLLKKKQAEIEGRGGPRKRQHTRLSNTGCACRAAGGQSRAEGTSFIR